MRFIVRHLFCFLGFVFCFVPFAAAGEARFFSAMADVPLMSGLNELAGQAAVFDKPEGRVAQSVALIDNGLNVADIEAFYEVTLPQLGWNRIGPREFAREDERLMLSFERAHTDENLGGGEKSFLRVLVKPVSDQ